MRTTTLGTVLLSVSITSAFVSVLFSNLSWIVISVAFSAVYVYAQLRFATELESTSLHIERKVLDEFSFATEPVGIAVEVLNKDSIAVRGEFEDLLPDNCSLSAGNNRTSKTLPPRSLLKMSYSIVPQKRGPLEIRGMKIVRRDALGLFEEEQVIDQSSPVNVHTNKGTFDVARMMAGREHLEFYGVARNPAVILREFEFDGIRDYTPGDRARDVQWKTLSKTGRLMTKTYRKEGAVYATVFVDCGRSMRLEAYRIAKMDHALDMAMQLSNVLISSYHPAGVVAFDEVRVIDKVPPAVGRHQFEKIVKMIGEIPGSVIRQPVSQAEDEEESLPTARFIPKGGNGKGADQGRLFLTALDKLSASGKRRGIGIGLSGGMKELLIKRRGQEQLFIVISDCMSSRDAVLGGARLCQSTGNRMLVIHTYDDWYRRPIVNLDMPKVERLYENLEESIKLEAAFRSLGSKYIRVGPADTAAGVIRAIRRGKV